MKNIIFGIHSVEAFLKKNPGKIVRLVILQGRQDKKIDSISQLAKKNNIKIEFSSREAMDEMTQQENHQGVIAFTQGNSHTQTEEDLLEIIEKKQKVFFLILDGVQDPHNLGACLRSADAAGVDAVIVPKDNAVGITPVVSKVASGAAETVPLIQVTNLARTMQSLQEKGVWIYGAAGEVEQSLFSAKLTGSIAIALGAEGAGLRRLTREHCDVLLKIPMQGTVSSLNVSVATGVFLFEAVRQRERPRSS
jgi:23S rRNA (guanosine2251-2'-O)-methyltransferase